MASHLATLCRIAVDPATSISLSSRKPHRYKPCWDVLVSRRLLLELELPYYKGGLSVLAPACTPTITPFVCLSRLVSRFRFLSHWVGDDHLDDVRCCWCLCAASSVSFAHPHRLAPPLHYFAFSLRLSRLSYLFASFLLSSRGYFLSSSSFLIISSPAI